RATAVAAGGGISTRRARSRNVGRRPRTSGRVRRDELVRPPAPHSYRQASVARDGGARRSQADRRPRDRRGSVFQWNRHLSPKPDVREVAQMEGGARDARAGAAPPFPGEKVEVAPREHRRNLTTLGVPLNHLVGKRFKVGEAVLSGGRLNFPCKYLEKLLARPVYTAL